jgi:hypothetical protein
MCLIISLPCLRKYWSHSIFSTYKCVTPSLIKISNPYPSKGISGYMPAGLLSNKPPYVKKEKHNVVVNESYQLCRIILQVPGNIYLLKSALVSNSFRFFYSYKGMGRNKFFCWDSCEDVSRFLFCSDISVLYHPYDFIFFARQ